MEPMASAAASTVSVEQHIHGPRRVLSVDMLRGITIAFMILVNDPGDWGHIFHQLDHSPWSGWTLTDLVFPCFLFLMGAAMVFSLASRVARGNCRGTLAGHILARGFRIELVALAMSYFPRMYWPGLRFYGVLPRIAICYVLAGLILLLTRRLRWLTLICAGLLLLYWWLVCKMPVPGYGVPWRDIPLLDESRNIVSYVDRAVVAWTQTWLHTGVLYRKVRDPEGLLSTIPSVVSVLLGAMAGVWMRRVGHGKIGWQRMRLVLLATGAAGMAAGLIWAQWFPINKNLWTSSFVLFTAGASTVLLALCSWMVDQRPAPWPGWIRAFSWPFFVFGANAIAAFVFSEAVIKIVLFFRWTTADGHAHTAWSAAYAHTFARHGSNEWTSLAFGISYVVFCFLPNWLLWRRRIFLKI